MTLQEKIFDEMKKRGITQRELSEITGIATSTINDWKMRNHVPAADKIPAICNAINISIADRIKPKNEHIYYFIDAINEAINTKRKIAFRYFAYTPAKKKALKNDGIYYILSPYTLTWNGDCYYVVGWSDKHGKVATFRVDRIFETPRNLPDKAVPRPKDYSIADFAEKAFQLFDADRTEVTLLCAAAAMNSVMDHFGDHAKTTPVDDKTFRLVAEVSLSPTFFAWVFQFGGKVQILEPAEAIEKYQALLEAGKAYGR